MEKDHMLSSQGRLSQLIKELPDERADYLFRLLHNAPIWLFEDIHILTVDANQAFIHEGDPVDRVYLLLDGKVRAVDYRIMNIECHYTHFTPVKMFGTMEALNSIGFSGFLTIEREVGEDPAADIRLAADFLRRFVRQSR